MPDHIIVLTLNFPTNFVNEVILLGIPTTFLLNTFPKKQGMFSLLPFTSNNFCTYYLVALTVAHIARYRPKNLTNSLYFRSDIKKHPSIIKELNMAPTREFILKTHINYKVPVRKRMSEWFNGLLKLPVTKYINNQITRKNLLFKKEERVRISSWRGKKYRRYFAPKKFIIKERLAEKRANFNFNTER